jgi:hypothetical protein
LSLLHSFTLRPKQSIHSSSHDPPVTPHSLKHPTQAQELVLTSHSWMRVRQSFQISAKSFNMVVHAIGILSYLISLLLAEWRRRLPIRGGTLREDCK